MSKQKHHLYEGMYILSTTLSDDARSKALDRIKSGITERGGEVHKTFDRGRSRLAYEVDGRREGYYFVLYFSAPAVAVTEMWRDYHLNEDLLRFLTLRAPHVPEKIEFKSLTQD